MNEYTYMTAYICQHCNYSYARDPKGSIKAICKCQKCHAVDDKGNYENMRARIAELEAKNETLMSGIDAVRTLIDHSDGVSGLHNNGDIAEWDTLQEGGHFEAWLCAFNEAELLSAAL